MSLTILLLIAFLFPLFSYLLILGLINRRRSPLLVAGTWDFVGVLFAMAGFVLAGSAYLLYRISELVRSFDLDLRLMWLFVALYFLCIVLVVLFVLAQRRGCTMIYNVHPPVFERVLEHILDKKGYQWTRSGNMVVIQTTSPQPTLAYAATIAHGTTVPQDVTAPRLASPGLASLTVTPSRIGRCVALRWECFSDRAEQAIRCEVERNLEDEFEQLVTEDNPLASWLVSLAVLLFVVIITLAVMLVLIQMRTA